MGPPWGDVEDLRTMPKVPSTPGFLWWKPRDHAALGPDSVTLGDQLAWDTYLQGPAWFGAGARCLFPTPCFCLAVKKGVQEVESLRPLP